jgi:hypothetical protein
MKININAAIKLAAATLIFVTLACGAAPTPPFDEVSTVVAATMQALTPLASPTSAPAGVALSTPTSVPPLVPTTSNLPAATRISFAAGSTQSVSSGSIGAAQNSYYVVRASKDQPMIVMLDSPGSGAKLSIFGANGAVLLPASQQLTSWQGILPATQDYYFGITGSSGADFLLNVIIPARIQFASGQNQVTLTGQTAGGYGVTYVAYALAGQKMDVTINTDPDVAALSIWGFTDGEPYARAQNGVTNFSMTLPSTQDYIIQVVPQGGQVVNYTVTIKIQ